MRFTFAVIADSHFHPPGTPFQAAWAADARFNDRNAAVAELLRQAAPAFVIHLGDVPHPVPGLAAHDEALDVAQALYRSLDCPVHIVPGNHDVGDKPKPTSPVPAGDAALRARFVERWGPLWQSFDHGDWRFVLIDTPILNTGTADEAAQWAWLEDLAADGAPWLAFLHYPPFLHRPDEPEHYDNLAEPARSRLLSLLRTARATFCGHVHHPFWHPLGPDSDLHILPATSFVRPGYSEASAIGPGEAFGRDDTGKLGLLFVHVDGAEVQVEHVATHPSPPSTPGLRVGHGPVPRHPLGATLRHRWDATIEIPADGLDPFTRKQATNDLTLRALERAGFHRIRLPVDDLDRPATRDRLAALTQRGWLASTFGTRVPSVGRDLVRHHELVGPADQPPTTPDVLWAPVTRAAIRDDECFSHFPALGVLPERSDRDDLVLRCPMGRRPWHMPEGPVVLVELPRQAECERFTDAARVAARGCEALVAALAHPAQRLYLDGFTDHDRGYFPRDAFVDRRGDPRPAHRALVHLNRLLPRPCPAHLDESDAVDRYRVVGAGTLWIPHEATALPAGIDLATGEVAPAAISAWPRWVPAA